MNTYKEYNDKQYELINNVGPMKGDGVIYPINEKVYVFDIEDIIDVKRDMLHYDKSYDSVKYYEKNEN